MSDKSYLRQLLHAAEKYVDDSQYAFDDVKYFYRNKPEEYFREVRRNNNTLKKIQKDNNGDRRSPINKKLSGVFLGVTLWQGKLPSKSPFGSSRVCFPIAALFKDTSNLYFTDFYCTVSENHYVTLVLTTSRSQEDVFCSRSLVPLDPENNMFFRRSVQYGGNTISTTLGHFTTVRRFKLNVEVFFTENVYLDALAIRYGPEHVFYDTTGIIGKGTSTWGGLRKNTRCLTCNPNTSTPEVTKSEAKRKYNSMVTSKISPYVPPQAFSMRSEPRYCLICHPKGPPSGMTISDTNHSHITTSKGFTSQVVSTRSESEYSRPRAAYVPALGPSCSVGPDRPRTTTLSRAYGSSSYSTFPSGYQYIPEPETSQRSSYQSSSGMTDEEISCCGKMCCTIM